MNFRLGAEPQGSNQDASPRVPVMRTGVIATPAVRRAMVAMPGDVMRVMDGVTRRVMVVVLIVRVVLRQDQWEMDCACLKRRGRSC